MCCFIESLFAISIWNKTVHNINILLLFASWSINSGWRKCAQKIKELYFTEITFFVFVELETTIFGEARFVEKVMSVYFMDADEIPDWPEKKIVTLYPVKIQFSYLTVKISRLS